MGSKGSKRTMAAFLDSAAGALAGAPLGGKPVGSMNSDDQTNRKRYDQSQRHLPRQLPSAWDFQTVAAVQHFLTNSMHLKSCSAPLSP